MEDSYEPKHEQHNKSDIQSRDTKSQIAYSNLLECSHS